jgi:hypothetical protein
MPLPLLLPLTHFLSGCSLPPHAFFPSPLCSASAAACPLPRLLARARPAQRAQRLRRVRPRPLPWPLPWLQPLCLAPFHERGALPARGLACSRLAWPAPPPSALARPPPVHARAPRLGRPWCGQAWWPSAALWPSSATAPPLSSPGRGFPAPACTHGGSLAATARPTRSPAPAQEAQSRCSEEEGSSFRENVLDRIGNKRPDL